MGGRLRRWRRGMQSWPLPLAPRLWLHVEHLPVQNTQAPADQLLHFKGDGGLGGPRQGHCLTRRPSPALPPHTGGVSHIQSFSLSGVFTSPIRHFSPWGLHQRDEPPKRLPLEILGLVSSTPTGLMLHSLCPKAQHRSSSLESDSTVCEEGSFADPKASARGARACWNSIWG